MGYLALILSFSISLSLMVGFHDDHLLGCGMLCVCLHEKAAFELKISSLSPLVKTVGGVC